MSQQLADTLVISIHAPTRGATEQITANDFVDVFQSTLPRGERQEVRSTLWPDLEFQSTLPRGERPWSIRRSR